MRRRASLLAAVLAVSCATAAEHRPASFASEVDRATESPEQARARAIAETAEWAEFFLQTEQVERLGLTRAALEARPPATPQDQDAAGPVIAAGRADAERCLPVLVRGNGSRMPMQEYASIVVAPDGEVVETRTSIDRSAHPDADRCLTEVIGRWGFQPVRGGGLLLVKFQGRGPERPLPDPPNASSTARYKKPRMKQPGCIQNGIRIPRSFAPALTQGPVTVKFLIGPDGTVSRFQSLSIVPVPIARELRRAVYACKWVPGLDAGGKPASIWAIVPLHFTGLN